MAGYYVPSSYSANYVANKKNEDGTRVYDSAVNKAGIDAQRGMYQLNQQYNQTINNAYANNLLANRGLKASAMGSGFKEAFAQNQQAMLANQMNQVNLSVQDTKQSIFQALGSQLNQIGAAQQQEVGNMRRLAGGLEQYYEYLKTLTNPQGNYTDHQKFASGEGSTFEDNYNKIFSTNTGSVAGYTDSQNESALSWEDWFRKNSGNSEKDTAWLDWLYQGGVTQYQDFIKNGVNRTIPGITSTNKPATPTPTPISAIDPLAAQKDFFKKK